MQEDAEKCSKDVPTMHRTWSTLKMMIPFIYIYIYPGYEKICKIDFQRSPGPGIDTK